MSSTVSAYGGAPPQADLIDLYQRNKENPGKVIGATQHVPSTSTRRPLQPFNAAHRAPPKPAAKEEDGEGVEAREEEPEDIVSKTDFTALCFQCEDEEFFKDAVLQICETLRDTSGVWTERGKALARMRLLLKAKEHSGLVRSQVALLMGTKVRDALCSQLGDRRSILLRDACATVSAIAARLGDLAAPLITDALPHLFKNLVVTVKAVSDSSHACLVSIIQNTKISPLVYLQLVLEALDNAHPALRSRCSEYLALVLEKDAACSQQLNEPATTDAVEEGVRKALVDGAPEARLMGRRAFNAFSLRWEDRAQRLWSRMDYGTQRQIDSERKEKVPRKSEPSTPAAKAAPASGSGIKRQLEPAALATPSLPALIATSTPKAVPVARPSLASATNVTITPKRSRTAAPSAAPTLNLQRSLALAANTAKMLSMAKPASGNVQPKAL